MEGQGGEDKLAKLRLDTREKKEYEELASHEIVELAPCRRRCRNKDMY